MKECDAHWSIIMGNEETNTKYKKDKYSETQRGEGGEGGEGRGGRKKKRGEKEEYSTITKGWTWNLEAVHAWAPGMARMWERE
jgi:hypothetical protein